MRASANAVALVFTPKYSEKSSLPEHPLCDIIYQKQKTLHWLQPCSVLASPRGFEPPAYRLGGGRSIQLSYEDKLMPVSYLQAFLSYDISVVLSRKTWTYFFQTEKPGIVYDKF